MDLTLSSVSAYQQAKTLGQVQIAVASKVLQNEKAQGDAAVQLIQAATQGVNQAGDQLVAAATGLGGQVDTYA